MDTTNIPRNLPLLQLLGDHDNVKSKLTYETIDDFLKAFEMVIVNQGGLPINRVWEACMIATIMHSTEKTAWFQATLMSKPLRWSQAKEIIKGKFSGDRTQSHYLAQLISMRSSRQESAIRFVERFRNTLRASGEKDLANQGEMLLLAMEQNHPAFTQQVRLAYAAIQPSKRPTLTVGYIEGVAPILDFRRSIPGNKRPEEHRQQRVQKNYKGKGKQQPYYQGQRRQEYKSNNQEKGSQEQVTKTSKPNPCRRCGKPFFLGHTCACQYCKKPWSKGHTCQEFLQAKADKYLARMATIQSTDHMQGVEEDDLECKSANKKRKLEENELTNDSFIVPITIEEVKLFALIDIGCNFSSIHKEIVIKYQFGIKKQEGAITLASEGKKVEREGTTNPLEIVYNNKNSHIPLKSCAQLDLKSTNA